jgi:hypothetical protein
VVGIAAVAGGGRSVATQVLRTALEVLQCSVSDLTLEDFVCDQHDWWTPKITNAHLASVLALDFRTIVATLTALLPSCPTDVVLIEDWRLGIDCPDYAPLNAYLEAEGRLIYLSAPIKEAHALKLGVERRSFMQLDALRATYFTVRLQQREAERGFGFNFQFSIFNFQFTK